MMIDRRKKQNELYWKSKELRDLSMTNGNYEQKEKMRKKQDELYKKFVFYRNLNSAIERKKKNEHETPISE